MTAVIEIDDQYALELHQFIQSLPESAIKLTPIKNDLDLELTRRIEAVKKGEATTTPLSELSRLRNRYVRR